MDKRSPIGPALGLGALFSLSSCPLPAAQIQIYECAHKGVKTFSDDPCGRAEKHLALEYQHAGPGGRGTAMAIEEAAAPVGTAAERKFLYRKIANVQQRITRLQNAEQYSVAKLTEQLWQGTEQFDLYAFRIRMYTRIHAVMNHYGTAIDRASTRLAELQARLSALPPPQP